MERCHDRTLMHISSTGSIHKEIQNHASSERPSTGPDGRYWALDFPIFLEVNLQSIELSVTFPPRHWIVFQFFHKNAIRGDLGKDPRDAVLGCPMICASSVNMRQPLKPKIPSCRSALQETPRPTGQEAPCLVWEVQESDDSNDH